jgi:hypothetical protein
MSFDIFKLHFSESRGNTPLEELCGNGPWRENLPGGLNI